MATTKKKVQEETKYVIHVPDYHDSWHWSERGYFTGIIQSQKTVTAECLWKEETRYYTQHEIGYTYDVTKALQFDSKETALAVAKVVGLPAVPEIRTIVRRPLSQWVLAEVLNG